MLVLFIPLEGDSRSTIESEKLYELAFNNGGSVEYFHPDKGFGWIHCV